MAVQILAQQDFVRRPRQVGVWLERIAQAF